MFDKQMSIIALTSIIAHEMIHQWTNEIGKEVDKTYECDRTGRPYDPHSGEFEKWMDIANSKHGLNVAVSGSSMTYDSDAASKFKSFAGLDYAVNESDIGSSYVLRVHSGSRFIEAWYA